MDVFSRFTTSGLGGTQSCDTTLVPGGVEAVSRASCGVSTGMMVDGGDAASSGQVPGDVARFPSGNSSGRSRVPGCARSGAGGLSESFCVLGSW